MEDSVVAAYLSLLLGCILQENEVRLNYWTSWLIEGHINFLNKYDQNFQPKTKHCWSEDWLLVPFSINSEFLPQLFEYIYFKLNGFIQLIWTLNFFNPTVPDWNNDRKGTA